MKTKIISALLTCCFVSAAAAKAPAPTIVEPAEVLAERASSWAAQCNGNRVDFTFRSAVDGSSTIENLSINGLILDGNEMDQINEIIRPAMQARVENILCYGPDWLLVVSGYASNERALDCLIHDEPMCADLRWALRFNRTGYVISVR